MRVHDPLETGPTPLRCWCKVPSHWTRGSFARSARQDWGFSACEAHRRGIVRGDWGGIRVLPPTARELIERQCAEVRPVVRNAGLTLTSDPHDTEWKSRAFEVSDPSVPADDFFGDIGKPDTDRDAADMRYVCRRPIVWVNLPATFLNRNSRRQDRALPSDANLQNRAPPTPRTRSAVRAGHLAIHPRCRAPARLPSDSVAPPSRCACGGYRRRTALAGWRFPGRVL